jgi:hypothetical protein
MGVKAEIHREGRIVVQTYSDPLDMKDIIAQQKWIVTEILDHATKPVHTIIDMLQVKRLPSNMLGHGTQTLKTVHPMGGQIVVVTNSGFLNTMADVFKRIVRNHKVDVFKTMDEAWTYYDQVLAEEDKLTQK